MSFKTLQYSHINGHGMLNVIQVCIKFIKNTFEVLVIVISENNVSLHVMFITKQHCAMYCLANYTHYPN